jgi:hypothetical protein
MRIWPIALAALALGACSPAMQNAPERSGEMQVAVVSAPQPGARVSSPLRVSGVAPADWFFENQFPVRLLDQAGEELAFAPATPRVNWTEPGDKQFDAELSFEVAGETPATLVLQEDMPGDQAPPREVRIPLTLAPSR